MKTKANRPFKLIAAGILSCTLLFVGCNRHSWTPEKKAEYFHEKVSDKLDLNQDQQAKLSDVLNQWKTHKKSGHHATVSKWIQMLDQESLDADALSNEILGRLDQMKESVPSMVQAFVAFHQSLNAEQRKEFKEVMEHVYKKRHHHH